MQKFLEQALRAKAFYGNGILHRFLPHEFRTLRELTLMHSFLQKLPPEETHFVFVGAGCGRLMKELIEQHGPREALAIEQIQDYAEEIRKQMGHLPATRIAVEDYFTYPYETLQAKRIVFFLNWSIVADFGSPEAIDFMFARFAEAGKEVLVIGDMAHQERYTEHIETYHAEHPEDPYGLFIMRHHDNPADFISYLPDQESLLRSIQLQGYTLLETSEYQEDLEDRYMFFFRKD